MRQGDCHAPGKHKFAWIRICVRIIDSARLFQDPCRQHPGFNQNTCILSMRRKPPLRSPPVVEKRSKEECTYSRSRKPISTIPAQVHHKSTAVPADFAVSWGRSKEAKAALSEGLSRDPATVLRGLRTGAVSGLQIELCFVCARSTGL